MTRRYQKQCHSKNGFSTPAKADEEIARSHRGRADKYFCPWCRLWHIGRKRRKARP